MGFDEIWASVVLREPGIEDASKKVVMTPRQFKLMLKQFYDAGYKGGYKDALGLNIKSSGEKEK